MQVLPQAMYKRSSGARDPPSPAHGTPTLAPEVAGPATGLSTVSLESSCVPWRMSTQKRNAESRPACVQKINGSHKEPGCVAQAVDVLFRAPAPTQKRIDTFAAAPRNTQVMLRGLVPPMGIINGSSLFRMCDVHVRLEQNLCASLCFSAGPK